MHRITLSSAERERLEQAARTTRDKRALLWRRGKDQVSANRVYEKVEEQAEAFMTHLLSISNRQTLRTTGCLSTNFWLST